MRNLTNYPHLLIRNHIFFIKITFFHESHTKTTFFIKITFFCKNHTKNAFFIKITKISTSSGELAGNQRGTNGELAEKLPKSHLLIKFAFFYENHCAKMQNTQKVENTTTFDMKKYKADQVGFVFLLLFCIFDPGNTGSQDFPYFLILGYARVFCLGFLMIGIYFLLFSFIFF